MSRNLSPVLSPVGIKLQSLGTVISTGAGGVGVAVVALVGSDAAPVPTALMAETR